jgi:N-methylhydantoinase A
VGQAFELPIAAPARAFSGDDIARFEADFHAIHERTYGHRTDNVMEIVNLRVICRVPNEGPPPLAYSQVPDRNGRDHSRGSRPAYFGPDHGALETPVLRRDDLAPEPRPGPLVVEEYDATVVVPPGCRASRDHLGNIVIQVGVEP